MLYYRIVFNHKYRVSRDNEKEKISLKIEQFGVSGGSEIDDLGDSTR